MATYRIGIGTEFKLDGGVGIGTDTAPSGLGNLKVEGTFKTEDLDTTSGIATFTRYAGFAPDNLGIDKDTTLTGEHQTTSDIVVGVNSTFTVSTGATVCTSSVESISLTDHFSPPCGGVEDRPECPVEGTVRFNKDLNTLEFYNGVDWRQFTVSGSGGSRCIIAGGFGDTTDPGSPQGQRKEIQYFNTATLGNSQYFGDLTDYALPDDGAGNSTRCLIAHQTLAGLENHIDYFPMSTAGNGVDFGDLSQYRSRAASVSSSTRALWCGGRTPSYVNTIDYVEISTIGNALDFGDLMNTASGAGSGMSPTRGVIANGIVSPSSPHYTSTISFLTMASKGNSVRFGENTWNGGYGDGCSNNTRALFAGGYDQGNARNQQRISAVTIASEGNAINFGDLHIGKAWNWGAGTQTRGFFGGGNAFPSQTHYNQIEYVSMYSGGQAIDFGDMVVRAYAAAGITNAHGGLGGY